MSSKKFYGPKSYTQLLQSKYSNFVLYASIKSITNYNRCLIQVGKENTKFLGIKSTSSSTTYNCSLNVLKKNSATYSALLGSTFQMVQNTFDATDNNSYYRIDSDLHANFSLDCTFSSENDYSPNLQFTNNWGVDRSPNFESPTTEPSTSYSTVATTGTYGYVVFSYSNNKLTAQKRYYMNDDYYINTGDVVNPGSSSYDVYNAGGGGEGHFEDDAFPYSGWGLSYSNGTFLLSSSSNSYIKLYNSPINFNIPKQFNPAGISRASNLATSLYVKGVPDTGLTALNSVNNTLTNIYGNPTTRTTSPAGYNYYNQLYTYDSTNMTVTNKTDANNYVSDMLDTIYNNSNKTSIRYPRSFYETFRTGLLKNTLASNCIMNAYLTGNTALQVYFTNELGTDGATPTPFMIILNTSVPSGPCRFLNVNKPPGDAINHNYDESSLNTYVNQYVTRSAFYQTFLTKIPMLNYGFAGDINATSGNGNNSIMSSIGSLASAVSSDIDYDYFNYASTSSCGIAIDSTQLYPVLNNTLEPSSVVAELTALGHHAGQGLGIHYHADSFQCNLTNLNLYNKTDYKNRTHPPIVGIGFDGIALYGAYSYGYNAKTKKSSYNYSNMEGYKIKLDKYGGHKHGVYGYHYHANGISSKSIPCYNNSNAYSVYTLMYGPWAGLVTSIPGFSSLDAPNQQTKYVGLPSSSSSS
jgi:hypothetical protein